MINKETFNAIFEKAKGYKYSSMSYIDFEDCESCEILHEGDDFILMQDKSKSPYMLHYAANDFGASLEAIAKLTSKLRIHFVPKEHKQSLVEMGFKEWGEYADFWNVDLVETASHFSDLDQAQHLNLDECEIASTVTKSCMLQSRGFEGCPPEFYKEWLNDGNHIITARQGSEIVGVCSISIYNEGTTLWIKEIATDPKYQGLGFGKKMLEQAIAFGVKNGAVKGFLMADILNKNAIGLYNKYGFYAKNDDSELQMIKE
ncbi:MAG: GNAT family N-acetyltransferase [Defluviitaleaceae bacterium]|nr:GNAT family N-acetyltransferase [Defluviitaleaceae bacterium]